LLKNLLKNIFEKKREKALRQKILEILNLKKIFSKKVFETIFFQKYF